MTDCGEKQEIAELADKSGDSSRVMKLLSKLKGADFYSSMIDDVERGGKGPNTTTTVPEMRRSIDRAKNFWQEIKPPIEKVAAVLKSYWGRSQVTKAREAFDIPGTKAVLGILPAAGEKTPGYVERITPKVMKVIEPLLDANRAVGEAIEPHIPGFKAWGATQRNATQAFMSHLRAWDSEFYSYLDGIKALNPGIDMKKVEGFFRGLQEQMSQEHWDEAVRRISQEFHREVPVVPSGIRGADGKVEWFLYHDPIDYLDQLGNRTPMRIGFRDEFGPKTNMSKLALTLEKEGVGNGKRFLTWAKAMHGVPSDGILSDPQSLSSKVNYWKRVVEGPALAMMTVKASSHVALSGLIGPQNFIFSPEVTAKGMAKAAFSDLRTYVDSIITDMSKDPNNTIRSGFSVTRNLIGIPINYAHRLQGLVTAGVFRTVVDAVKAGELSDSGKRQLTNQLKILGYTDTNISGFLDGKAADSAYDSMIRRAVSFYSGRGTLRAELSAVENTKWFPSVLPFNRYPLMQLRIMDKSIRQFVRDKNSGGDYTTSGAHALKQLLGVEVRGAALKFTLALMTGGVAGLKMAANEDKDKMANEPFHWLGSMFVGGLGGPLAWAQRTVTSESPTDLANWSASFTLWKELAQTLGDNWKDLKTEPSSYAMRDIGDTWKSFGARRATFGPTINTWFGIVTSGAQSNELDVALKGVQRFEKDEGISRPHADPGAFANEMRRATTEIRAGRDPSEIVLRALDVPVENNKFHDIAASLNGRRVLASYSQDQIIKLRSRVGSEAVDKILAYDDNLAAWAMSYSLAAGLGKEGYTDLAKQVVKENPPEFRRYYQITSSHDPQNYQLS